MREIKFRAWDKKRKTMYYNPWYLSWYRKNDMSPYKYVPAEATLEQPEEQEGDLLMQYTGLKDKNGIEIYEGDIKYARYCCCNEWVEKYAVMKWDNVNACFYWDKYFHDFIEDEVIGNIYENPELIKEEKC